MKTEITTEDIERQYLSDEAAAEFDRIVGRHEKRLRRKRLSLWAGGIAAAMILTVVFKPMISKETPIDPVMVAEGITGLMNIDSDRIESIVAKPKGSKAIVTAYLKNGETRSYIMTTDDSGWMTLTAVNINQ